MVNACSPGVKEGRGEKNSDSEDSLGYILKTASNKIMTRCKIFEAHLQRVARGLAGRIDHRDSQETQEKNEMSICVVSSRSILVPDPGPQPSFTEKQGLTLITL